MTLLPPRLLRRVALALTLSTSVSLASLTVTPNIAFAQPKRPKSIRALLPKEAHEAWDRGVFHATKGDWKAARGAFLETYNISRNPRVLFNVGVMAKNTDDYAGAVAAWERELSEGRGLLSPEEEEELAESIRGLQGYMMSVTLDVSEPGARVYVDDEEVGQTPLPKPIPLKLSSHVIRVSKAGFADALARVDGSSRTPTVKLQLEPMQRTSTVTVTVLGPPSATVRIDGREVGTAPYTGNVAVAAEPHVFSASAPGYVEATQSVVVREGDTLNLTLSLAQDQQKGRLLVVARPTGATIEIDGTTVGATRWEGPVDRGTHQVVVRKQGYYDWTYDVDVPKGGERTVTAQLNEDRNTSFVPWLVGTVLVFGGSAVAAYFIAKPNDEEPVRGTLPPFAIGTQGFTF